MSTRKASSSISAYNLLKDAHQRHGRGRTAEAAIPGHSGRLQTSPPSAPSPPMRSARTFLKSAFTVGHLPLRAKAAPPPPPPPPPPRRSCCPNAIGFVNALVGGWQFSPRSRLRTTASGTPRSAHPNSRTRPPNFYNGPGVVGKLLQHPGGRTSRACFKRQPSNPWKRRESGQSHVRLSTAFSRQRPRVSPRHQPQPLSARCGTPWDLQRGRHHAEALPRHRTLDRRSSA
jgi:hypothetical protein